MKRETEGKKREGRGGGGGRRNSETEAKKLVYPQDTQMYILGERKEVIIEHYRECMKM